MILVDRGDARVRGIVLSAPGGNALDIDDLIALEAAARDAAGDDAVEAIVLTGADGAFSTGARVDDLGDAGTVDRMAVVLSAVVNVLGGARQPVIARVDGDAMGGGVALLGAADIVIASPRTRVALPEVRYGLMATVAIDAVAAKVGKTALLDLVLTGRAMPAAEACAAGLISEVAPEGGLDELVAARLRQLSRGDADAMAESKRRVRDGTALQSTPALPTTEHGW